jgi:hypothetical protein
MRYEYFDTAVKFGHQAFKMLGYIYRVNTSLTQDQIDNMDSGELTTRAANIAQHGSVKTQSV